MKLDASEGNMLPSMGEASASASIASSEGWPAAAITQRGYMCKDGITGYMCKDDE